MNKLISVIINVYNGERFINKCIDSVINQTYKNLDILIVNDGSKDNTLKICKSYNDKRIRIITTKNLGLSKSRNVGIDNAKGEYLYFLDADDFIENDTIEYLYNLSKEYRSDFITCKPLTIFDYDYKKQDFKEKITFLDSKSMLKKILMNEDTAAATWNKLLHKNLFDDLRFEDRIINDIAFTYKLAIRSNNILYSNQVKYLYLKHKDAVTVNKFGERLERVADFYKVIFERYNNINKLYPNFIENKIALLRGIMQVYVLDNDEVKKYLDEQKAVKTFNEIFTFKMLFAKIRFKEKMKLFLFKINPNLYRKIGIKYRKKYKFNM